MLQFASLTAYLAELVDEDRRRTPEMPANEMLVSHLFFIASEAQTAAQALDNHWTERFNSGPETAK